MKSALARDFIAPGLVTVTARTGIHRAVRILLKRQILGVLVIDENGELVSILSVKDCTSSAFTASYHQDRGQPMSEIMSAEVQTIESDTHTSSRPLSSF